MPVAKLFDYPYSSFLMLRREFEVFCQEQDLEVKILRVIEMYVENERTRLFQIQANRSKTPVEKIEIPRDVWVPITYNLFRSEIYDEKISDNTLKAAIKSLEAKKLIQKQYAPKKRYDPPTYRLQVHVIDLLNRFLRISGGQKLIPSKIDTLKNLPPQFLIPSFLSTIEDLRVSKIDTNSNKGYEDKKEESVITPTLPETQTTTHPLFENPVSRDYTITPSIEPVTTNGHTSIELPTQQPTTVDNSPPSNQPSHSRVATRPATHVGKAPVMAIPLPPGSEETPVVTAPPSVKPAQPEEHSQGARDIRRMYDKINGYITGHPEWEWKKMEEMARDLQEAEYVLTQEDMKLVYNHIKPSGKYTVVHVWENWKALSTLKTTAAKKPFSMRNFDHKSDPWAMGS